MLQDDVRSMTSEHAGAGGRRVPLRPSCTFRTDAGRPRSPGPFPRRAAHSGRSARASSSEPGGYYGVTGPTAVAAGLAFVYGGGPASTSMGQASAQARRLTSFTSAGLTAG